MIPDPIVEEVRAIQNQIAKEYDYDVASIFDALRQLETANSTRHMVLSARKIEPANMESGAATPPES